MREYFDILGIPVTANENEIKKAFKEKAKALHPDRNKSPKAHEEFLSLYEAFKRAIESTKQTREAVTNTRAQSATANRKQKEKYDEQAERYAKMQYEAWINSQEYKNLVKITTIGDSCTVTIVYGICLILPVFQGGITSGVIGGIIGLAIGITIILVLKRIPVLQDKFQPINSIKALFSLTKYSGILVFLLFALNLYVFFTIGLSTVIWISILLGAYIASYLFVNYTVKQKNSNTNLFKRLAYSGGLVSLILCINYYSSSNPYEETYSYIMTKQDDSLIEFQHQALKDYVGIRLFNSIYFKNDTPNAVTYHFEKGGLGIPVVKKYKFIKISSSE